MTDNDQADYGHRVIQMTAWQTGRYYGPNGQRIAAALLDNGDIIFEDIDRAISGRIEYANWDNGLGLQVRVMGSYDRCCYKDSISNPVLADLAAKVPYTPTPGVFREL